MDNELIAALNNLDWDSILKELYAYAYARHNYYLLRPAISPEDLVHEAVKKVLHGERKWDYKRFPDIVIYLKSVIKSIANHSFESTKSKKEHLEEVKIASQSEPKNLQKDPEIEKHYQGALIEIEDRLLNDEELLLMYYAMQEGHFTDKDLSAALNRDIKEIRNIKKRMRRRIANIGDKLGIKCTKNQEK